MRVFVSYRRSDSKDVSARIADNLRDVREVSSVFLDVESIAHGEHFPARLQSEIEQADVVLCIIGPQWRGQLLDDGTHRIASDSDFVRSEVASALAADKRIIPVLVDDAAIPSADDLPEDIAELASHNAISMRHTHFKVDFEILAEAILGKSRAKGLAPLVLAIGGGWRFFAGLLLAAIISIAIASLGVSQYGVPLETILGGRAQLAALLLVIAAACQFWTWRFLKRNSP